MSTNGNPLLPEPPSTVVVNDVVSSEVDPRQKAKLAALGQDDAGWFSNLWGKFWASLMDGIGTLATHFARDLDIVIGWVAQFFQLAQGEKNPQFYDLCGKILEDLTGVQVDTAALKQSAFGSGRLAGMEKFGGDLFDLLVQEFKPASGDLETPSADPAKTFLGFLMNWSIRQGNIEVLTSMLPDSVRIGEGFRTYGELMAKNLALGRMARRALQPLIQTLVADPLQYQLNAQYLPKRLAKEQAIKAYFRGVIDLTQLRNELSQEGYSPSRQDFMIADSRPILSDREIVRLFLRTQADPATLNTELEKRGWTNDQLPNIIALEQPQLTSQELTELYIFGQIGRDEAKTGLLKLGYGLEDAENIVVLAEMKAGVVPHKKALRARTRTVAQLRKEYIDGVINLVEWDAQLTQLGYSADDNAALTQDLLIDAAKGKTTASKRAMPSLTWAQLKDAYKSGILSLDEVTAHLTHRGYSTDDVATLIKELPAPPAPPSPPTT
jgi:hypothetical protein